MNHKIQSIFRAMAAEYPESLGSSIVILEGTRKTRCFSFSIGDSGWCQVGIQMAMVFVNT